MIIHLSSFPRTLSHSGCKRLLYQQFPLPDPQDLSNGLKHCNTGSPADLKMQLICRSCTFWIILSVPSTKIFILVSRLYTLIRYHEVRPVTLNGILLLWVLYAKFLSLCMSSWATFDLFLKATHTAAFLFLVFTSLLSIFATFELDTEDTGEPTDSTFEPFSISYSDPCHISTSEWECLVWTLRKGDCKVNFVLLSSLLEKDELMSNMSYKRHKWGQRSITQTARRSDWDYFEDIKENPGFLNTHTPHTHI